MGKEKSNYADKMMFRFSEHHWSAIPLDKSH